ncbi:MAG: hypothetical protein IJB51_10225 [Clostridia bacterium]|nr:hypothetical protein [Clostridia bacterium]
MKTRFFRTLSLVCVLVLVLSLCSVFSFAEVPEAEATVRANYIGTGEVCSTRTYLYNSASTGSGYVFNGNVPVDTPVNILAITGSFYHVDVTVSGRAYNGYLLKTHVSAYFF